MTSRIQERASKKHGISAEEKKLVMKPLIIGLNMPLVIAFGPCIFFCLELIPAFCKNIGIGSSINFLLKKNSKLLVLVPALCKNIDIGATWCEMIGPRGTSLVLCFFNRKLTERPIPIFLQSAGTNAKQKKVQRPMPKFDKSAGTNDTFKP
ncbi:hypothetical protein MtrunA17_Chr5g0433791 [Medicago truncatula]|uniref:Transmembrane protein, putative n=1 Tax=Medicago truncatula TaxID=3880 RepID=G7KFU0_MEDTR|nr:transmembrane protein, putative [Medicago truncatula]RHN56836.1 hypothetical protein MtrunA17_Chr5g0433791 [Medicago truncatula]